MTGRCISEPISWLRLERHALAELAGAESRMVEGHLDDCSACRGCFEAIRDTAGVELPALPAAAAVSRPRWWRWPNLQLAGVGVGVAAVAVILLFVARRGASVPGDEDVTPPPRSHIKGGDVAIDLVRERAGSVANDPQVFATGDRFKVLFTCPVDVELEVDVLVAQDGEISFPLAAGRATCGNRVARPGAFTITGRSVATVCVVYRRGTVPDRAALERGRLDEARDAVCVTVRPAAE